MRPDLANVALVAATGPDAANFRVRGTLLAPALREHGVALDPLPLFDAQRDVLFHSADPRRRARILLAARRAQRARLDACWPALRTVLLLRQADLLPPLGLEKAATDDRKVVYDVDDAIWNDARRAGGHPLAFLKASGRKAAWLARRADHVVAATPLLAEWLGRHARDVTVIPSLVDTDRLRPRRHAQAETLTVGWVGSPSTSRYLGAVRAPLARLAGALPDRTVVLDVVGGEVEPIAGVEVVCRPWTPAAEDDALERMDVGIMPLPDDPWTRGKAAYKAIQYMGAGVPVVADAVGAVGDVVDDAGLLTTGEDAWFEALASLAGDAGLRARLGAAGRERATAHYSIRRWAPTLAGLLRD
jgi:glycosyltransferase involved in cell wall biosynthesis